MTEAGRTLTYSSSRHEYKRYKVFGDFAPFLSIALLASGGTRLGMDTWMHTFQVGFITGGIATSVSQAFGRCVRVLETE